METPTLLAKIDSSWHALQAAIMEVSREEASKPGVTGDWSLKDLLGHIAFWDEQAIREARRRAAGEPPRTIDVQALNEEDAAANRDLGYDELYERMQAAHTRLIAALSEMPMVDPDAVEDDTWDHYDEHAAEIRAWLARQAE